MVYFVWANLKYLKDLNSEILKQTIIESVKVAQPYSCKAAGLKPVVVQLLSHERTR